MSDIEYIDVVDDGIWITGKTREIKSGMILTTWTKLSNSVYDKKFWFIHSPKKYLKTMYNYDIDEHMSDALTNLFEHEWIDFCYLISSLPDSKLSEILNLYLGPIAAYAKLHSISPLKSYKSSFVRKLILDDLTFNQKKNILLDSTNENFDYDESKKKYSFAEISDEQILKDIHETISTNQQQWEKAKIQINLQNWFVGQIMKKYKGKIDATRVKALLNTILETA